MVWDIHIQEAVRIGEKMVAANTLKRAGYAFDPQKKKVRIRKKSKLKFREVIPVQPHDKLHKLADAYRPKEPK